MEKKVFIIPKISCGHCVAAVKEELMEMQGVGSVDGDPAGKSVTVAWEAPATEASIRATLEEINYPAE